MASPISFQGLSTNLPTDKLVDAILQQEGLPLQRLQDRQALNGKRRSAIQSLRSNLTLLSSSIFSLNNTAFSARTVSSSDSTGSSVTATASGAAAGSYDVKVTNLATRAQLTNLSGAESSMSSAVGQGTYAIRDTDGTTKTFTIGATNDNLVGMRDAINGAGAGVTATIVNTGAATNPYKLVLSAKDMGTGTVGAGTFAIAQTSGANSSIGIQVGTLTGGNLDVGTGTQSNVVGEDAAFTLNGVSLTRKSNVISDAAEGVTFTLKQEDASKITTLTIGTDKSAITSALQDVASKYNAALKTYKDGSATDASGNRGPLANDSSLRMMLGQVRSALMGVPEGLPAGNAFTSAADLGFKTNRDGTLSLDTSVLSAALDKDPAAASRVFGLSGTSSSPVLGYVNATSASTTKSISFAISGYNSGTGAAAGVFTVDGQDYSLTASNGVFSGGSGTPLEGLTLSVAGNGTGTFGLTRGSGQALRDLVDRLTASTTGNLSRVVQSIDEQNLTLGKQISNMQARLDRRKEVLQIQYANLEATIGQMQSAGKSLSGMS